MDSFWSTFGGSKFPAEELDLDPDKLTFEPLDPQLDNLIGLFAAAIDTELGNAWTPVCASLPVGATLRNSTAPIGTMLKVEPTRRVLSEANCQFPILAIHRSAEAEIESFTLSKESIKQQWQLHWILGQLTAGEAFKLSAALQAVAKIIHLCCKKLSHPAYDSGRIQFGDEDQNLFAWITVTKIEQGAGKFAEEDPASFYGVTVSFETLEYSRPDYVGLPASGLDGQFNVGGGDELQVGALLFSAEYPSLVVEPDP